MNSKNSNSRDECLSVRYGKEPGILNEFIDSLYLEEGLTRTTAYNYYMSVRYLAKFLKHRRNCMDCAPDEVVMAKVTAEEMMSITSDEWDDFLDQCQFKDEAAKGSYAVRISVVRSFYKWLADRMGVEAPTFVLDAVRPLLSRDKFVLITPGMEEKLCTSLEGDLTMRNACIIRLALRCGLGVTELCNLDLEDINIDSIIVRDSSGAREIPLDQVCIDSIDAYLDVRTPPKFDGNPFFVSAKDGRMKRGAVEKMLRKLSKRASPELRGVTLRDLRMTALSRMVDANGVQETHSATKVKSQHYFRKAYSAQSNARLAQN